MNKGYLNGLNFVIEQDDREPQYIPLRSCRIQPVKDQIKVTDMETNQSYVLEVGEVFDENDAAISDFQGSLDYLSSVIGGFNSASGGNGAGGDTTIVNETNQYINESVQYSAATNQQNNINNSTALKTVDYKAAVTGTFDDTVFVPVASGVQILKQLSNVEIEASTFIIDTANANNNTPTLGLVIAVNGTAFDVEDAEYSRRTNGANEGNLSIRVKIPNLSPGDVVTAQIRSLAALTTTCNIQENKGALTVFGFTPTDAQVIVGIPNPVITSISTT